MNPVEEQLARALAAEKRLSANLLDEVLSLRKQVANLVESKKVAVTRAVDAEVQRDTLRRELVTLEQRTAKRRS